MDTKLGEIMKIETLAISSMKWGIILPVVGSFLMACGAAVYAAVMVINLGSAEVDVTKLPVHP